MIPLFLQERASKSLTLHPPGARAFGGHNSTAAHINSLSRLNESRLFVLNSLFKHQNFLSQKGFKVSYGNRLKSSIRQRNRTSA